MIELYTETIKSGIEKALSRHTPKQLGLKLFEQFFAIYPEAKSYFQASDVPSFAARKFQYLADFYIDTVEHPNYAEDHVSYEVDRHQVYGVADPEYYYALIDVFQDVILSSIDEQDAEVVGIWRDVATAMKAHIKLGADLYL